MNEVLAAATRLVEAHGQVLVTRASVDALAALQLSLPNGRAHPRSSCFTVGDPAPDCGPVAVLSAGTSDEPVAEECAVTLAARGRHDPCVLPRAVPIVEAMVAVVLVDAFLRQRGQCGA